MKIYDITQELFGSVVWPGDPTPQREILAQIADGAFCNVSALHLCAHNGTHVDAPYHFIKDGKTVDEIPLTTWIGRATVVHHTGDVTASDAEEILRRGRAYGDGSERRILIGGRAVVTEEAARVFAAADVLLVGNESQTVGPESGPMAVHLILLGAGIVLLEGVRLGNVPDGSYLLQAAPLLLAGCDGAPCRAVLLSEEEV